MRRCIILFNKLFNLINTNFMEKKLCQIHHLFYKGEECPLCRQERIERYSSKYKEPAKPIKEDKGITEEYLQRLKEKFNSK